MLPLFERAAEELHESTKSLFKSSDKTKITLTVTKNKDTLKYRFKVHAKSPDNDINEDFSESCTISKTHETYLKMLRELNTSIKDKNTENLDLEWKLNFPNLENEGACQGVEDNISFSELVNSFLCIQQLTEKLIGDMEKERKIQQEEQIEKYYCYSPRWKKSS